MEVIISTVSPPHYELNKCTDTLYMTMSLLASNVISGIYTAQNLFAQVFIMRPL